MAGTVPLKPSIGTGIYTYSEAAALLKVSVAKVRRWAEGYAFVVDGGLHRKQPVLQGAQQSGVLTFYDLIELFIVKQLREHGVKLEEIRSAGQVLSARMDTAYPFACSKLETDGWQILTEIGGQFVRIAGDQLVFDFVKEFFKTISFDEDTCLPREWHPLGLDHRVVVDPGRSWGLPVDSESGVRVDVIVSTYQAEGDMDAVADWYSIPREAVKAAVEFETEWLKAA